MKTSPARLAQMHAYHKRTRTPERKEVLAKRSRRWYAAHPEQAKASHAKWRENNPEDYQASRDRSVARTRDVVLAAKATPCADCGVSYPYYVMDFDHVRGVKKFVVAKCCSRGLEAVKEEILKCDVVCANCHRERTHQRRK